MVCAIRDRVADLIGVSRFRTWFGDAAAFSLDGERLSVTVPNRFIYNWICANYMPQLTTAARDIGGGALDIAVHVSPIANGAASPAGPTEHRQPAVEVPPAAPAFPNRAPRPEGRAPLRGELESFVVGPSNELAYSVVSTLVRAPGEAFKHLVLHGGCGLGKTHLLQGICNGVAREHPQLEWRYISGEEFTNEFIYAVKSGRVDHFRARFRSVDILVIDDIHFLANKKATQEEFLHTFNAIDASGKTVVLSTDRHPRAIATLSEPLIDRLIAAMVVEIQPPDLTTRREIVRRRSASMQCQLCGEVLDFLAQRITRNVRELEGALFKLAAYASLTREPVGLDLARRIVEDYLPVNRPPEPHQIERLCATYFGITVEALHSESRDRTVTLSRACAMYLIRKHTRLSFPEIGRMMGNKQHSTVLMAVRRVQELIDHNGDVAWKTPGGLREALCSEVVNELEQRVLHPRE